MKMVVVYETTVVPVETEVSVQSTQVSIRRISFLVTLSVLSEVLVLIVDSDFVTCPLLLFVISLVRVVVTLHSQVLVFLHEVPMIRHATERMMAVFLMALI